MPGCQADLYVQLVFGAGELCFDTAHSPNGQQKPRLGKYCFLLTSYTRDTEQDIIVLKGWKNLSLSSQGLLHFFPEL